MSVGKKEKDEDIAKNISLGIVSDQIVEKYGSAAKEHFVAYSGTDNEVGKQLQKGLKEISGYKVNPEYEKANLRQQAGFSAEVKQTARVNAERKIQGKNTRLTRTDDIGAVNDQLFDHVELDGKGKIIPGSGSQMKFVGSSPEQALTKLASKKFEKYLDADAKLDVPKDYYEEIKKLAGQKAKKAGEQAEFLRGQGRIQEAEAKLAECQKYKKIETNLRQSTITNEEAKEARINPELSVAKDVVGISHRAGIEQAKQGAVIGGTFSIVTNVIAVAKGEKEVQEAAFDLGKDVAKSAATSYVTAFAGTAIKGAMQNSGSAMVRAISKTNVPAIIVTSTIEVGKTLGEFISGKINGQECIEQLGEKGVGIISSTMFGIVGQIAIPIPVVGAMVGSMVGYMLSSSCYKVLVDSLKQAGIAKEERKRIETYCEESIKILRAERARINLLVNNYLTETEAFFCDVFDKMDAATYVDDIDGFIDSVNLLTTKMGGVPEFCTFSEFDDMMMSNEKFKL